MIDSISAKDYLAVMVMVEMWHLDEKINSEMISAL